MLIMSQVFAFNAERDTLRVRVHGTIDGRSTEFVNSIPIKSEFAKNKYVFPLRGVWYVGYGASFTPAIGGPFRKSLRSILRRSVRVASAIKAMGHASMIITLMAPMCLRQPMGA
jgi:hypothetical protein